MKYLLIRLMAIVVALTGFVACEQEADQTAGADEVILADELAAVEELIDMEDLLDEDMSLMDALDYGDNSNARHRGGKGGSDSCRVVSVDSVAKLITVSFVEDCEGCYGRTRSGKILISYTGSFEDGLGDREITYEDYYVGKKAISGMITIEDLGENESGQQVFVRTKIDHLVTFDNDKYRLTNGSTTRVFLEGYGDDDISTNVVQVTGGFESESSRGTHSYTILEPILLDFDCKINNDGMLRSEGIVQIIKSNEEVVKTRTVDYGAGCDNEYTVTVDEEIIEVTL
ncbi:MAG: hypothetical protein OCD76_12925 [Reichenbachiella sp.]